MSELPIQGSLCDEVCSFSETEFQTAYETWGANCGPTALAAVLGKSLQEIRPHMGDFERMGYTTPNLMFDALRSIKAQWRTTHPSTIGKLPTRSLLRVQWGGPWMLPEVPIKARYRHTHWIAAKTNPNGYVIVYDVNAMSVGGWIPLELWVQDLAPWIIRECCPRGDGKWSVTHIIELMLPITSSEVTQQNDT